MWPCETKIKEKLNPPKTQRKRMGSDPAPLAARVATERRGVRRTYMVFLEMYLYYL
jgi:hypothetical protein